MFKKFNIQDDECIFKEILRIVKYEPERVFTFSPVFDDEESMLAYLNDSAVIHRLYFDLKNNII